MKNNSLLPLCICILLCFCFAQCKKTKTEPTELSKLPAATQIGANTFGCLVNGKAWVAQRNDCSIFCPSEFKIFYDGSYGGLLNIEALKIDINNNIDERFDIALDSSNFKTIHSISILNPHTLIRFKDYKIFNNCSNYEHYVDSLVVHSGQVKLTKYDLSSGIVSGIFNLTLTKPGCETILITEGRFDKKL